MALIALIVNSGDAPPDARSLPSLMRVPPYLPVEPCIADAGTAALGYVPLRGQVAAGAAQPRCLGGRLWAVLDGRLDGRDALVRSLQDADACRDLDVADDLELMLRAYDRWGSECLSRLAGEFAFCVWDRERRELFCARDRFGVKPLYYAQTESGLVLSNALNAVRRHPAVPSSLRTEAIGDFLLFGMLAEPSHTAFDRIERLPPAHRLRWRSGDTRPRVERYWSLRPGSLERYSDPAEYVERFTALLRTAVAERMGAGRAGVLMSGGLDSSSVATFAADVCGPAADRLRAFTVVYESLMQDEERQFAGLTADRLRIARTHLPADRYEPFDRWQDDARPPEPTLEALTAVMSDLLGEVEAHASVVLTGDGGDPLLLPSTVLEQAGHVGAVALARDLWRARSVRPLGIRSWLAGRRAGRPWVPAWLSGELLEGFDPLARWHDVRVRRSSVGGARRRAADEVSDPWWPSMFEGMDPGATGRAVEPRYAFFDLRLVSFALCLPSFPWCQSKRILRESMRGRLPEPVRTRPKAPLPGSPVGASGTWTPSRAVALFERTPGIDRFVDVRRFRATVDVPSLMTHDSPGTWSAVSLAAWLRTGAGEAVGA